MKIIRTLGLFIGWLVLLGGIIQLLVSGKIFAMYPQLDAFYGLIVGVLIIWLSIERIHPEGYKFFGIFLIFSVVLGFRNNIHVYFKKSEDLISARIQIDSAAVYNESFCNNVFNSPIDYVHPDDLGIAEFIIEGSYKGSVIAIL
ncbi:MAG: hypothetical protein EBW94_02025, partial [Proteobacteria bacterium]|nr:hypothetical protein [Pseudomonadota bacterium]